MRNTDNEKHMVIRFVFDLERTLLGVSKPEPEPRSTVVAYFFEKNMNITVDFLTISCGGLIPVSKRICRALGADVEEFSEYTLEELYDYLKEVNELSQKWAASTSDAETFLSDLYPNSFSPQMI